jgi:hypothetical protein
MPAWLTNLAAHQRLEQPHIPHTCLPALPPRCPVVHPQRQCIVLVARPPCCLCPFFEWGEWPLQLQSAVMCLCGYHTRPSRQACCSHRQSPHDHMRPHCCCSGTEAKSLQEEERFANLRLVVSVAGVNGTQVVVVRCPRQLTRRQVGRVCVCELAINTCTLHSTHGCYG